MPQVVSGVEARSLTEDHQWRFRQALSLSEDFYGAGGEPIGRVRECFRPSDEAF